MEGTSASYYRIFDSVLTGKKYPIRTIIAPGSQALASTRGTKRMIEALKKLDFFVILDTTRTADMPYADMVMPISTMYEIDHPFEEPSGNWIMARNKVIEPIGETKSDYEFWLDLGNKMGYGEDWWNGDIRKHMDWRMEPLGMTYEELRSQLSERAHIRSRCPPAYRAICQALFRQKHAHRQRTVPARGKGRALQHAVRKSRTYSYAGLARVA